MFRNGNKFIRADFHLHTKEDKEFKFSGDDYIKSYVNKLESEDIRVGMITNHNKFNWHEYKKLKREANRRDMLLLPGVELSVMEGLNGLHTLIIFKEQDWLVNSENFINKFLDSVFGNISNRENENTTCKKGLLDIISILDEYEKDYFIIMAHIEGDSGFYSSLGGGIIKQLSSEESFKKSVLGFQKSKTYDIRNKLEDWMDYKIAYVEGSDPKNINEIGRGRKCYLKLGDYSFEAIKLSLKDYEFRVSHEVSEYSHSYIDFIHCKGDKLNEKYINLSPELNTLIGIRGSGKSSILELIRYTLDIDMGEKASDKDYKESLITNTLGSGGVVTMKIVDLHGRVFHIKRINGHKPVVYDYNHEQLSISTKTLIKNPLYFGQKDLSSPGKEGFELSLLNKLLGDRLDESTRNIERKIDSLISKIKEWRAIEDIEATIKQLIEDTEDKEHKMVIFKEKGVADKLEKQSQYESDKSHIQTVTLNLKSEISNIKEIFNDEFKDTTDKLKKIDSEYNHEIFVEINTQIDSFSDKMGLIKNHLNDMELIQSNIHTQGEKLNSIITSLQDEFAEIRRDIKEPNLDTDSFIKYSTIIKQNKQEITELETEKSKREALKSDIQKLSNELNFLLIDEFNLYKHEIENINKSQDELKVEITFKGDKEEFLLRLKSHLKGTNLSEGNYKDICSKYNDFVELYEDIFFNNGLKLKDLVTDKQFSSIQEKIDLNYQVILRDKPVNKIEITYHGKLLKKHSLGQRASALILFILTQDDNDLIMIDQPEDDLDNQVIYTELINTIKVKKKNIQFVFATHNANIPVLGDSEKVIACSYDDTIEFTDGSIDVKGIQDKIVNIMEGGPKAFRKRNQIYNIWDEAKR